VDLAFSFLASVVAICAWLLQQMQDLVRHQWIEPTTSLTRHEVGSTDRGLSGGYLIINVACSFVTHKLEESYE